MYSEIGVIVYFIRRSFSLEEIRRDDQFSVDLVKSHQVYVFYVWRPRCVLQSVFNIAAEVAVDVLESRKIILCVSEGVVLNLPGHVRNHRLVDLLGSCGDRKCCVRRDHILKLAHRSERHLEDLRSWKAHWQGNRRESC